MAQIFNVTTGERVCTLKDPAIPKGNGAPDLYIRTVCFSPDGKFLATGAEDRNIRIWDITSQTIAKTFQGHAQDIYSLDWSRDGNEVVSGSGDRTVKVWNATTGECLRTLVHEPESVPAAAIVKDTGVTSVAIHPRFNRCLATVICSFPFFFSKRAHRQILSPILGLIG